MTDETARTTSATTKAGEPATNPDELREAREPLKQHGDALLEGAAERQAPRTPDAGRPTDR